MEDLYKQTISLGQETDTRTRFISVPVQGAASHDHCEENGRGSERKFLRFGSLNDLLGHLARQGYAAEKAVGLVCAEDALSVMDMIQHHLDEERSHDDLYLRKTCIRCLLYLNKRHGTLPTSIHLSKVTKDGHHPVSGGGFADIYKGRLEGTQQTVCLKVLRVYTATYDEKRLLKQLSNEVLIWRQLKHPNILQFLGITKEIFQPSYCIVSPWMANGTVISYSQTRKTTLNDKVKMMYEISEGIRYLHEHQPRIVHSDIKGLNILVSDDGKCCLADFGLAAIENDLPEGQVHLSTSQAVIRGSVPWLAPELMNPNHIGVPSRTTRDIYALGCTIFELLTGNAPFSEKKMDFQIIMEVLNGSRPDRPPGCPDLLWWVVESCWKEDFHIRPTAAEVAGQLAGMISQRELFLLRNQSPCSPAQAYISSKELETSMGGDEDGARIWATEEGEVERILVGPGISYSVVYDMTASNPELQPAPSTSPILLTFHSKASSLSYKSGDYVPKSLDTSTFQPRESLDSGPYSTLPPKQAEARVETSNPEWDSRDMQPQHQTGDYTFGHHRTTNSGEDLLKESIKQLLAHSVDLSSSTLPSPNLAATDSGIASKRNYLPTSKRTRSPTPQPTESQLPAKRRKLRHLYYLRKLNSDAQNVQQLSKDCHNIDNLQERRPSTSVDMSGEELELDLFSKKPKQAWSGLGRKRRSGLELSDLMNPDPEIFPADHPYRSSGDVGMSNGSMGAATPTEERKLQQEIMHIPLPFIPSSSSNPWTVTSGGQPRPMHWYTQHSYSPVNSFPNHNGFPPRSDERIPNNVQGTQPVTPNIGVHPNHTGSNMLGETSLNPQNPFPPLPKERFSISYKNFCDSKQIKHNPLLLSIDNVAIDLHSLHTEVMKEGGLERVQKNDLWAVIAARLGIVLFPGFASEPPKSGPAAAYQVAHIYKEYLAEFDRSYVASLLQTPSWGAFATVPADGPSGIKHLHILPGQPSINHPTPAQKTDHTQTMYNGAPSSPNTDARARLNSGDTSGPIIRPQTPPSMPSLVHPEYHFRRPDHGFIDGDFGDISWRRPSSGRTGRRRAGRSTRRVVRSESLKKDSQTTLPHPDISSRDTRNTQIDWASPTLTQMQTKQLLHEHDATPHLTNPLTKWLADSSSPPPLRSSPFFTFHDQAPIQHCDDAPSRPSTLRMDALCELYSEAMYEPIETEEAKKPKPKVEPSFSVPSLSNLHNWAHPPLSFSTWNYSWSPAESPTGLPKTHAPANQPRYSPVSSAESTLLVRRRLIQETSNDRGMWDDELLRSAWDRFRARVGISEK